MNRLQQVDIIDDEEDFLVLIEEDFLVHSPTPYMSKKFIGIRDLELYGYNMGIEIAVSSIEKLRIHHRDVFEYNSRYI